MGKRSRIDRKPVRTTVAWRGELWLIVDWASGERIAWGPWRSWVRFRTAVASWRREPRVNAVRVIDRRPTKAHADTIRTPVGRP